MPIVTLTTDFGMQDWFVGTMKGVVLNIAPKTRLVDIAHEIEPGNIRAGAFALAASFGFFPRGSIHLAVVDPGVGSQRQAIAIQTDRHCFVGPDNGVLSWAIRHERVRSIRVLDRPELFLDPVSRTFHGRDVFAPVAAHLAAGTPFKKIGAAQKNFVKLEWPEIQETRRGILGEVMCVDRFGNAITNIPAGVTGSRRAVCVKGKRLSFAEYYQDAAKGAGAAIASSSGFIEIAVNGGSAAMQYGLKPGDKVTVEK